MKAFKKIIVGSGVKDITEISSAFEHNIRNLKDVWNDKFEPTFGIERVFKLILVSVQFLFPSLYLKELSGRFGLVARKISSELYVFLKIILPLQYFYWHISGNQFVLILNLYLLSESVFYLFSLIFLSDIYKGSISNKRSVILIFLNYIEISLCYAVFYKGLDVFKNTVTSLQAIYFSVVTSTTLGYGDLAPDKPIGYLLVISQVLIMLIFVALFISYFVSNINRKGFGDPEHKEKMSGS